MKRGSMIVLIAIVLLLSPIAGAVPTTQPAGTQPRAVIIELKGEINDFNRDQFIRRFEHARELGATTIIVDLDTYGGLVTSGLEISRYLKRQDGSQVHTIAYVQDKAISAGAMIAMSCDEIVMSPSATLGDCAPIVFQFDGKLEELPPAERAKQESPIASDFEDSAARNHHDPLLARAMVSVQLAVYWVQDAAGHKRFVDANDHTALLKAGWEDVPGAAVPVDGTESLLTVDTRLAVDYGLATTAFSAQELASSRSIPVAAEFRTTAGDKLVEVLGSLPVRMLLIIIFFSCANIIFHAPGHGVAEVIGLGALLLMLGVPMMTGYAQWWEILMIFAGLTLIAVEILLPGHMLPGIVGACFVLVGLIASFVPKEPSGVPIVPQMNGTWAAMAHGLEAVAAALAISLVVWTFLNRLLPSAPYFKRLIIHTTSGGITQGATAPGNLSWLAVGAVGKAASELKPGGSAKFLDPESGLHRAAAVISDSGFVEQGAAVVVREVAGNRIVVRPA